MFRKCVRLRFMDQSATAHLDIWKGRFPSVRYRTLCLLLVAIGANWFWSVPVRAQDPDFTNENDILHGERTLLQATDLEILTYPSQGGPLSFLYDLTTSNSTPGTPTTTVSLVPSAPGTVPLNFSGRMFNLPGAVTILLDTPDGGGMIYSIQYPGPNSGAFHEEFVPSDQALTGGAVADFNEDGYDDLVLGFSNGAITIATAVDVNIPSNPGTRPLRFGPTARLD